MHEGKVVHFEDDKSWRGIVERQLKDSGHQLVGGAETLPDALHVLDRMASGEVDANVVLLDGNLSEATTYRDASTIRSRISELGLAVRVIGLSGGDFADHGIGVDAMLSKANFKSGMLTGTIDGLPEPEARV